MGLWVYGFRDYNGDRQRELQECSRNLRGRYLPGSLCSCRQTEHAMETGFESRFKRLLRIGFRGFSCWLVEREGMDNKMEALQDDIRGAIGGTFLRTVRICRTRTSCCDCCDDPEP